MPIPWLEPGDSFPPTHLALTEPDGLLAAGADLTVDTLLAAYARGIFPWFSDDDPILWWTPSPRCVLHPEQFYTSRRTQRRMHNPRWRFALNTAFEQVMLACATTPRHGQHGTWITDDMLAAYRHLHHAGYAHSFELWEDEQLVGGLYGVRLGRMFFGESMFSHRTDASKAIMTLMMSQAEPLQIALLDCQVASPHLLSLGATTLSRPAFESLLEDYRAQPVRPWQTIDPAPFSNWQQLPGGAGSKD